MSGDNVCGACKKTQPEKELGHCPNCDVQLCSLCWPVLSVEDETSCMLCEDYDATVQRADDCECTTGEPCECKQRVLKEIAKRATDETNKRGGGRGRGGGARTRDRKAATTTKVSFDPKVDITMDDADYVFDDMHKTTTFGMSTDIQPSTAIVQQQGIVSTNTRSSNYNMHAIRTSMKMENMRFDGTVFGSPPKFDISVRPTVVPPDCSPHSSQPIAPPTLPTAVPLPPAPIVPTTPSCN